jgi:hypothetical protein
MTKPAVSVFRMWSWSWLGLSSSYAGRAVERVSGECINRNCVRSLTEWLCRIHRPCLRTFLYVLAIGCDVFSLVLLLCDQLAPAFPRTPSDVSFLRSFENLEGEKESWHRTLLQALDPSCSRVVHREMDCPSEPGRENALVGEIAAARDSSMVLRC